MLFSDIRKATCCLCGSDIYFSITDNSHASGFQDLDSRPSEMRGSKMYAWVQRCTNCGYCASDITIAFQKTKSIIQSKEYTYQLKDKNFSDLANSFLCKGIIAEKEGKFSEAAKAVICAAWTCDDDGYEKSAKKCRIKALELLRKGKENGECFAEQDGADIAITTDLLRRSGKLGEALALIKKNQGRIRDDTIKKILAFQKNLILRFDTKCYKTSDFAGTTKRILSCKLRFHKVSQEKIPLQQRLETLEKEMVVAALKNSEWLQSETAKSLGISERVLCHLMGKHKISRKNFHLDHSSYY